MKQIILLFTVFFYCLKLTQAQPGQLDPSFGTNGIVTADFAPNGFKRIAVQEDGKIVVAASFALARYNTDGSPDNTFSEDGKDTTDFMINAVIIQKDGKIVTAGSANGDFEIMRYNNDGSLDNSFSDDGKQITDLGSSFDNPNSMALQSDGKIVVTGMIEVSQYMIYEFAIARYNTDGSLDNSFDNDGKLTTYFNFTNEAYISTVAIQSDGKIVVAGSDFTVARYNTDGSPDNTFDGDGVQRFDFGNGLYLAYSLAIQEDGKIVAAGSGYNEAGPQSSDFILLRLNADGSLDNTFSEDGKQTTDLNGSTDVLFSMVVQNNGKIVVGGYIYNQNEPSNLAIARYNTDGNLDNTFGNSGKQIAEANVNSSHIYALAISGNKLCAAGAVFNYQTRYHSSLIARYLLEESKAATVKITNPANNTSYTGPATINISAAATAPAGGTISKVELYNGNTLLSTDFTSPYSYTWSNVPAGNYTLTAKAIDNSGLVTASAVVNVSVVPNKPPVITITNPGNNASYTAPATINISADANDQNADGSISKVTFYNGSTLLAADTSSPYNFEWSNVPEGDYKITAKATDNSGLVTTSAVVNISVAANKPPTIDLTIPYNIVNYTGPARIKLNAAVANVSGKITKVQFYNGTSRLHTETEFPYGFLWVNVPAGNYTLTAKAFDSSDNVTTSNSIEVSVTDENVPPVVSIVSPADDTTYTGPATIRLIANAKDPNDKISKVEFYNGTALLRTEYYYPYTYTWTNVQAGTYTISAIATDDKGLSAASDPVTVTVTNASFLSRPPYVNNTTDPDDALSLKLSPNPARSTLQIFTKGLQLNKPSAISVISASGVVMKTIQSNASNKVVQLDVSSLVSGVYSLKFISGDKVMYKQFVKL